MATPKQIAANRRNAQKATGPRTTLGKEASRFNALMFGVYAQSQLIFDESAPELAELAAQFHDEYRPAGPTEQFLVDTLVNTAWRLRRLRRVEAGLFGYAVDTYSHETPRPVWKPN
jgi:hypothetical protein